MPTFASPSTLRRLSLGLVLGLSLSSTDRPLYSQVEPTESTESTESRVPTEATFLTGVRQMTFEGLRAGEGYFSRDGKSMVFQSERLKDNPFYQIYWMDRETGDIEQVSPGYGKTTCAWIHPEGDRIMFASTQFDPNAVQKQKDELTERINGTQKRYSWSSGIARPISTRS
jgi:hypothetical protein